MEHRTVVTLEVAVMHRFAVGDKVSRPEPIPAGFSPADYGLADDDVNRSVWRIVEVGYDVGTGPWYRLVAVNEIARFNVMNALGRTIKNPVPLVQLMTRPVTERVSTVDRQCQPYEAPE